MISKIFLERAETPVIRAAVIGATGYAGGELVRILPWHPDVQITFLGGLPEESGVSIAQYYPSLLGVVELSVEQVDLDRIAEVADVVFLALPHTVSMLYAGEILRRGLKVIDFSADYRLKDPALYEKFYGKPHCDRANLEKAVYGLPEIFTEQIREATLLANPGCFPTGVILAALPPIEEDLVDLSRIIVDSKTGVSGAGRRPSPVTHFAEANEDIWAYKVLSHQHSPEMETVLAARAKGKLSLAFVPHLAPMTRGILSSLYLETKRDLKIDDILNLYTSFYRDAPFVRVLKAGDSPHTRDVSMTNFCDIGVFVKGRRLVVVSAIDNLVKGASGQAVQNMNIMYGLPETKGLLPERRIGK